MNEEELLTVSPYDTRTLLPAAVAEQGPNDRCLLRVARQNTGSLPALRQAFEHALAGGVAAATASDYALFDGILGLIDPLGRASGNGEPFDESPWTARACAELIEGFAAAPVYIVNETVWVAERRGRTEHRFEVILPRLLRNPARTAWWASAALNGMATLDEEGWFRGTKRAPCRVEYEARTTPWSVLSLWLPPIGHQDHWACRARLSKHLVAMLLRVQKDLEAFDAPDDHACFETSCYFSSARYLSQNGMPSMQ